jgi:hypothetical protein
MRSISRNRAFKTASAQAACFNAADQHLLAAGMSNGDLLRLRMAARAEIAERMDNKQLTPAQATLELAKLDSQLSSTAQGRDATMVNALAQSEAAAAATRAARPVSCTRIGYTVNCY